jgi:hypothetical protein
MLSRQTPHWCLHLGVPLDEIQDDIGLIDIRVEIDLRRAAESGEEKKEDNGDLHRFG